MADADDAGTDDYVRLSEEALRELIREEARVVAREETKRTRSLFGSIVAGLFGFVILGQSLEAGGALTTVLVGVGTLVVAAGAGVSSFFGGD
ncbi:hypothetical protein SAMN04487948_103476 [Halogranum amylolyticum]|uniref:Uncharacterized protein n=1 Tax=Halogranum amylolyticum TaxID=660520 RepID=A0A1H8R3Q5_9EURY|nr:hypothetical protein [Halogranum amylolyticum]SEO60956.1 hypothetical protein SAMN04487948_103476 [Halogranum amylolyticum]